MWTRTELKDRAKAQMRGRYWTYLGVSLIPFLVSFIVNIPISVIYEILLFIFTFGGIIGGTVPGGFFDRLTEANPQTFQDFLNVLNQSDIGSLLASFLIPYLFMFICTILISILIMKPLQVGIMRWYIRAREDRTIKTNLCFTPFRRHSYGATTAAMLYYSVWIFLWSLLLYIPAVFRFYAYRMTPFILADNPRIGARRALRLSIDMTKGHRLDLFVLDLSFAGWFLLGNIACGIGLFGVVPYYYAVYAEVYDAIKREAVEKGLCTMEELGYVAVSVPSETAQAFSSETAQALPS